MCTKYSVLKSATDSKRDAKALQAAAEIVETLVESENCDQGCIPDYFWGGGPLYATLVTRVHKSQSLLLALKGIPRL